MKLDPHTLPPIVSSWSPSENGHAAKNMLTVTAPPVFDPAALYPDGTEHERAFVEALATSTQTPREMVALLSLAVVSAAVAGVADVRGHGDHVEPAQIFGLVVTPPATRKTSVVGAITEPVELWEREQAAEWGPKIAAAIQRRKIAEKRLRTLEDAAAKSADAAAAAAAADDAVTLSQELAAEKIPTSPMLLASEPTPESLARQMANNCGRALIASAEADGLDIARGRYSGTSNFGIMLKGHGGDAYRAPRVGREGESIARCRLAVALCVQPTAVAPLWADAQAEGRGLLARFAIIAPDCGVGFREVRTAAVPEAVRARRRAALLRLLAFVPSDSPSVVTLGDDADRAYLDFQRQTERALGPGGDLWDRQAWGGKLAGLVLRIALSLHALRTWAVHGSPDDFRVIDGPTMAAAIAWGDYLAAAELHARSTIADTDDDRELRRLIGTIRRAGGDLSARELIHRDRRFKQTVEAENALQAVVDAGFARWVQPPQSGRGAPKARRCVLVPLTATQNHRNSLGASASPDSVVLASTPDPAAEWAEVPG